MYPSWVYSQEKFQSIMAVMNDSDNKKETDGFPLLALLSGALFTNMD